MNLYSDSDRSKTCSFTGYRPHKLSFGDDFTHKDYIFLKNALTREIEQLYLSGIRYFQTGMAMGSDMLCAEIVIELKEKYPDISLFAVMPCHGQSDKWNDFNKERHRRILENCDGSLYVTNSAYDKGCMFRRNRYLADTASVLLAVYDGQAGGTSNTLKYAQKQGLKIIVIDPYRFVKIKLFDKNNTTE